MPKRSKFTFILAKINVEVVDTKYGFALLSNIDAESSATQVRETTLISELPSSGEGGNCGYSFVDESKKNHRCVITMQDLVANERLPVSTTVNCWWCRHPFSSTPIGCPVSFVPGKVTKSYHSEITKDKYSITDNITRFRKSILDLLMKEHESVFDIRNNHDEYFIVDGVFCSFNCCMAYIRECYVQDSYNESEQLLYHLYSKLFSEDQDDSLDDVVIKKAPHWRLLRAYGGPMSIEDFRESFKTVEYVDVDDHIFRMPQCRVLGHVFQKKFRF
jgi:hypothetical protein